MIHFALLGIVAWIVAVVLISISEDAARIVDLATKLGDARRAQAVAEHEAACHRRTIQHLQYELDQRNGWLAGDDFLSPIVPPALTLMEEYQPHVIEWLPYSLN